MSEPTVTAGSGGTPGDGGEGSHRIGVYRILNVLGEGGMGTVYLAEQEEPVRRRVALKVVKAGMDSKQIVARFEAERQALALMSHPGIAAVLDAGASEQGRPYFVMEYVAGEPITQYCDRHKLDLRARLELFIRVCHAVQHAHTKALIHRDIKPSNILVSLQDGQPNPKVIDFGVAKAVNQRLSDRTVFTEHGVLIGTPEYMSPEQAEMSALDIDTRTDIYSLGVLLYELVTGMLPFDPGALRRAGYSEIQRIIREVEPLRPSTRLNRLMRGDGGGESPRPEITAESSIAIERGPATRAELFRSGAHNIVELAGRRGSDARTLVRGIAGDLDWIVMKCLEKDRTRRYETANDLAMEIRRYLTNQPVMAGPPSATYRIRKFVRRNRGAVAAALGLLLVTTGASIALGILYRQQREARLIAAGQRDRAVAAEQKARGLLAESYAQAARLAEQRGAWRVAIENYQRALAEGHAEPNGMRVGLVNCFMALGENRSAKKAMEPLVDSKDLGPLAGRVTLLRGELAWMDRKKAESKRLIAKALEQGVPPGDAAYGKLIIAETMPDAARQADLAIAHDPFNRSALTMGVVAHLFCGESIRAEQYTEVHRLLFPDDPTPMMILAAMRALRGGRSEVQPLLDEIRLRGENDLADATTSVVEIIESGRSRFREGGGAMNAAGDFAGLVSDMTKIMTTVSKAMPESSAFEYRLPGPADRLNDLVPAFMYARLGQYKKSLSIIRELVAAVPLGDLRMVLVTTLLRAKRLDEAADEAGKLLEDGKLVFVPREIPVAVSALAEIAIVERDSKGGKRVIKRPEQLARAIRIYARGAKAGLVARRVAPVAIEIGELDAGREIVAALLAANPRDFEVLVWEAELERARGAYGPALESAAAALAIRPKDVGALRVIEDLRSEVGQVGPPGRAVSVEEYLRGRGLDGKPRDGK